MTMHSAERKGIFLFAGPVVVVYCASLICCPIALNLGRQSKMRRNGIAEGVLRVASLADFWRLIGEKLVFHGRRVVARCNSVVACESTGHIVLRQAARHAECP
jgi:hypothetical protein